MSNPNSIDHSQAAIEAASKYAQDKCLNLVHSAATIIIDPPQVNSSDEQHTPNSIDSSAKLSSSANSPTPNNNNNSSSSSSRHDDVTSSLLTDEPGDFGIDRQIVQAALAALGPDSRLSLAGKTHSSNGTNNQRRPKKKLSEMDEDERLLASSEAKKLTARQRRQIRNRVSARQFRLRRKEYILQLEALVVNMTTKITGLQKALAESKTENKLLKETKPTVEQHQQQQQQQLQQQQQHLQQKQHQEQLPHQPLFALPEYSQTDAAVSVEGFPDLFTQEYLNNSLNINSYQENHFNDSPSSSSINSPWSSSKSDVPSSWNSAIATNTNSNNNSIPAMSAETIRMSPNIINLLPPYPDQLLEWPQQSVSDLGYIQVPNTRIYHSKVPHAKDQLVVGQKQLEKDASMRIDLSSKLATPCNPPKEKKVKTPAEDKLSSLMVDTLFRNLDLKMGTLKI